MVIACISQCNLLCHWKKIRCVKNIVQCLAHSKRELVLWQARFSNDEPDFQVYIWAYADEVQAIPNRRSKKRSKARLYHVRYAKCSPLKMSFHSKCINSGEVSEHLTLDTPHTSLYPLRYFVHKKTSANSWLADSQFENLDGAHSGREVVTIGCSLHFFWPPPSSILSSVLQRLEN